MNLPAGYSLQNGKYQLFQVVGQGGFGITYRGILFTEVKGPLGAIKTEVPISIKEYFFKDYCYRDSDGSTVHVHSTTGQQLFQKFKEKLIKEAKILSDVHHPHIVNVLDVFEENNTAYIAMEYISGHSLKYILEKDGIFPEAKVLKYIHQIGNALQFVHEKNILHLDIKPSNILIDKLDNARLIDFGVSKRYDTEDHETSTTMLTLSKGFASIEQYDNEGTHTFSPCPDVYSLGATMYNLLSGKIPTESILRATRPFPNPSEFNPSISAKTEEVILKAMQISPADRYQSMAEMIAALDIPPLKEIKTNTYTASNLPTDYDETTLVYSKVHPKANANDDDETVLKSEKTIPPVIKNKRGKGVFVISLICIFVALGVSVAYLIGNNVSSNLVDMPPETITETDSIAGEPAMTNMNVISQNPISTEQQPSTNSAVTTHAENVPQTSGEITEELDTTAHPSEEEIAATISALVTSSKAKMNAGNIAGAEDDFNKAAAIKFTPEVERLHIQLEDKKIEIRRSQYDDKLSFGDYKIVKKKSTGRYGAIDNKGNEWIPCRYLQAEKVDENSYAFQREDKLFDIYYTNGQPMKTGITNY
jgi:serine/threonine-protein kinase